MNEEEKDPANTSDPSRHSRVQSMTQDYRRMRDGAVEAYYRSMTYFWPKLVKKKTMGVIKPPVSRLLDLEDAVMSTAGAFQKGLE